MLFGAPQGQPAQIQNRPLHPGIVVGQQGIGRNPQHALTEHHVVMPQPQGILHLLETPGHHRGQLLPVLLGHLQGIAQRLARDAQGVRILHLPDGRSVGFQRRCIGLRYSGGIAHRR